EELCSPGQPLPVRALYEMCLDGIRSANVVIAVLDGPDADSGTSFECGFAAALGKPVIGLRTDLRRGGDDESSNVNLMLSQAAQRFVSVPLADVEGMVAAISMAIGSLRSDG